MKTKKIILISCFILILSLNAIYATTDNNDDFSDNVQEITNDEINQNNQFTQESKFVYVDINSETVDEDGSLEAPYKTLNNENLEKISDNSTVYVSKGTYQLNPINIQKNISVVGENRDQVIFVPNVNTTVFIIDVETTVTFSNFTFKNYESDSNSAIVNNGNLTIENLNILNNTGSSRTSKKGNIFNNGSLEIVNTTFENNTASFGAALYNTANATILNSQFNANHIYNVGGAIYSLRGNLTVLDSLFTENTAVSGAAMYNAAGYCFVNNTKFIENDAEHFFGGAIYSTGVTRVNNSLFDSNHATIDGGAITNTNNFTIINCSFIENFAKENGGAIENVPWSATENGNLTIINSSFIENAAGGNGGVIMNYGKIEAVGEIATVTVRNSLFEANSATNGGVIYNEQYLDFQYNVFLDNEAEEYWVVYSDENMIKSLDNNWWGNNNPVIDEIGVMPKNWIILTFTNTTPLIKNLTSNLQVSLDTLNNGEIIAEDIPDRIAIFSADKTTFAENNIEFKGSFNTTVQSLGDTINLRVDNQLLSLQPLIIKKDVFVTFDEIKNSTYGDNVTISGKFSEVNGRTISNSNVKIIVNGKKFYAKTDNKGFYSLITRVTAVGINNVSIGYSGNDKYNSYEVNTTFNAEKQNVLVTYNQIADTKVGENITITGKFMDANGRAITNSNVKILINGKKHYAKTDSTGTYTFTTTVVAAGINDVTVAYSGNDKYNSFEEATIFNADSQDVIITYEPINNVTLGDNVTITGTFTDKYGKAIVNSNVKLTVKDKKVYAKTDVNGVYTFQIKVTSENVNNITLGYSGSAKYNEYYTPVIISVKN